MKYTSPKYENVAFSKDVLCASYESTTYKDSTGNTVQEMNFSFSSIFKK